MKNRLVYIEPNDIAKEKLINASPNLTNVAWDAEDYNIYVDLQVVCPNRDDCGQETVGLGNNNYISLLEGVKLNKCDKYSSHDIDNYNSNIELFTSDISKFLAHGKTVILCVGSKNDSKRIVNYLELDDKIIFASEKEN